MTQTHTNTTDLRPQDDATLVASAQTQGAAATVAFTRLIQLHQGALLRRCQLYLKNREDAEDAAQETILRAYRALHAFKGDASFRTWLFAIADNQCHTLSARRRKHLLSDHMQALIEVHERVNRERDCPDAETVKHVRRALETLPAASQDVVMLRYYQDMSLEEVAATTGLGLSATKMRLYRALNQLGRHFSERPELLTA